MEFEHVFQQSALISTLQVLMLGSVLIAGAAGRDERYRRIIEKATTFVVTFAPMAMLIYVLYSVSRVG